ncbi:hypothetical protein Godav_028936 [Gossypium davidsonii]|uniref:DUF7745 domain-containing protein n=1 Tax=Gossypium davidsonii TaxID=34287 RepID=A0A7J8TIR0_GOSDV|nr:hypothetical protein [Gossypium davidsonii]
MSEDTQGREGDCQIASFDSSLPQIVRLDCRRNHEDVFKGIWKSWDEAKKTHFQDKYGNVAQFLFVKSDDALLKIMVHFWDPTYKCLCSMKRIWDAMGKANGDRHLSLFAFAVYGLIVFPKALGYVSVELVDFLFHIEKVVNLTPEVLTETIISLNFIRGKGDRRFLGCTQLFVWMKSHFKRLYKHFRQVPLIGILGAISYSSLIVLSQYGYDQYIPTTTGLNRVEASVQDLGFWKKLKEIRIKWGQTLIFAIRKLFQPFFLGNVNPLVPKKKQNLCVSAIQGKEEDLK